MKKSYTIIKLILSILVTLLVVALFVFFLKVIKNKNQTISASMAVLQGKIKEKEDSVNFSEKILEIKEIQISINDYFINADKIDTFVDYLEGLGSQLGSKVLVKNIELLKEIENTIAIKLSIIGTFEQVSKTIILLENIPYQVNITQVYFNNNIKEEKNEEDKIIKTTEWQADVSFNILSLD